MITDYRFELRKLTDEEKLYDKVKEYVNLAEGIVTDDIDVVARYQALAGLYKHIDNENGGYIDPIRNAPDIDGVTKKEVGGGDHCTGNALSRFIKYAKEEFHKTRLKSVDSNGVEHYTFGLNWHPQKGFEKARELLFMLLTVIGYDGEFYWKQVKIRTGNELPKFWEEREKTISEIIDEIRDSDGKFDESIMKLGDDIRNRYFDIGPTSIGLNDLNAQLQRQYEEAKTKQQPIINKLSSEIQAAGEEAKRKAKETFPVRFAGVAPDGRLIIEYSDEIQKIQEIQKPNITIQKMTREEEMELIHDMEAEDRLWVAQPGKKDSRQGLYYSIGRYVDDIKYYLDLAEKNRSIDTDISVFRGLRNVLAEMLHDNGGYARDSINVNALLVDIDYPDDWDYGFQELLKYTENQLEGGLYVWWVKKNASGITNGEIVFSLLVFQVMSDVCERLHRLDKMGVLAEDDKKPAWEPIAGVTFEDNTIELQEIELQDNKKTDRKQTGNNNHEPITHLLIDGKKAKMLYKALSANDVDWLVNKEKYDEISFTNQLTSIPTGEKIILHQVCQIYYVTKKVLFHDKARMAPEEWGLIRQLFDAEEGEMYRVNTAYKKHVKNQENFDKHMGIAGRIASP